MVQSVTTGAAAEGDQTAAPEGHDQSMATAYDQAQEQAQGSDTSTAEGGDEKILGKFDSYDDLAEAYRNLEAKLSQGGGKQSEGNEQTQLPEDHTEREQAAQEAVERAEGVDMQSLSQEYMDNGDLTDASYQALEKAGIPRETVQEYIQGQEARAEQVQSQVLESIGGQEQFDAIGEWASTNLSPERVDAYNAALESGDPQRMQEAVQSLAYQYSQARPQEPNLLGGGAQGAGESFQSVAQLTEAMSDSRYQTDPAYRKSVEQKLARSNIL